MWKFYSESKVLGFRMMAARRKHSTWQDTTYYQCKIKILMRETVLNSPNSNNFVFQNVLEKLQIIHEKSFISDLKMLFHRVQQALIF